MPNRKAFAIQLAKTCESLILQGVSLELMIPTTHHAQTLQSFYSLQVPIPVRHLRVPSWYRNGRVGYTLSSLIFTVQALAVLMGKILRGEHFIIYTIDADRRWFIPLSLLPRPVFCELHGPKEKGMFTNFFFRKGAGFIATNGETKRVLTERFNIPPEKLIVEPNGVDVELFASPLSKEDTRKKLGLPFDVPVVLYAGRIISWKGLDVLTEAAKKLSYPIYILGGTEELFKTETNATAHNLQFLGMRPFQEVPIWLAAADVLLVLGTKANEDSYRFTAPMKVFEYMAAKRPVVASATPALKSIIEESLVHWYTPDDANSLAHAIQVALQSPNKEQTERAYQNALTHSWSNRAKRTVELLSTSLRI